MGSDSVGGSKHVGSVKLTTDDPAGGGHWGCLFVCFREAWLFKNSQSFPNQLSGGQPAEQRETAEQHTAGVCLGLDRSDFVCTKCKLVSILEEKIEGLEQQITTLRCIRETEDFLDKSQDMLLRAQSSKDLEQVAQRSQEASEEAWQHVTSRRRRGNVRVPATRTQVTNRFHVLSTGTIAESGPDDMSGGRKQKETPLVGRHEMHCPEMGGSTTTTPKRRRRVVVVGDSLLQGTESSICRPDRENREVCCLPGAKIRDVTERLPRLIKPSDRYPFLLLHVGTNDTAKNDLERITADYMALGRRIKEFEAQVVFSSILPVEGKCLGRDRRIVEVNEWLRRWCRREGFGFFDHGMCSMKEEC
ncbi:uncharacterized protein [Lepidochelys kempii]|uniref:uncharacterized protein n=1 Tax=Lepidochelys kempii TaxID=8472 RepID=UPI003C6F7A6E